MFESQVEYAECLSFIINHDPSMQRSLTIIEEYIFSNNPKITITGQDTSDRFRFFFVKYFIAIARQIQRYNLFCGFVPWTVDTLSSGEKVPKVLPIGAFSWTVIPVDRKSKKRKGVNGEPTTQVPKNDINSGNIYINQPSFLQYNVECLAGIGVEMNEIMVSTVTMPTMLLGSQSRSSMSHSQRFDAANMMFSPLVSITDSYMRLERAQNRKSYADDWNTTARIVTSNNPPRLNNDAPDMALLDGLNGGRSLGSSLGTYKYENMQLTFSPTDVDVESILTKNNGGRSQHCPVVYTLPQHYNIQRLDNLTPIENTDMLYQEYEKAVSQLTGVPLPLIQNCDTKTGSTSGDNSALFDKLLSSVCKRIALQIEEVMQDMYTYIYHPEAKGSLEPGKLNIKFNFQPLVEPEEEKPVAKVAQKSEKSKPKESKETKKST
jgi:hypothetical protein